MAPSVVEQRPQLLHTDQNLVEDNPQVGPSTLATGESSWWEQERILLLAEAMSDVVATHVDVGCGRGSVAVELASRGSFVVAVDMFRYDEWAPAPNVAYVIARIDQLPFREGVFDRASALDVIEHAPDDSPVLDEMRRVCADAAKVVITVPADPRLWSAHDVAVGHHRRYTSATLRAAADRAGFVPRRVSHFFTWLFVPAWIMRKRPAGRSGNDGGGIGAVVARVLGRLERWWLRRGTLPFGTSLMLIGDAGRSEIRGRLR